MPARASSPICPVLDHLAAAVDEHRMCGNDVLTALSGVADPRARRGVRHRMTTILAVALCAVLAGARSFVALGEWAANASPQVLSALGVAGRPPSESTLRRNPQRLDADDLDAAIGTWTAGRPTATGARRALNPRFLCVGAADDPERTGAVLVDRLTGRRSARTFPSPSAAEVAAVAASGPRAHHPAFPSGLR